MSEPVDSKVSSDTGWDLWDSGHDLRYWTLSSGDGGEPQTSSVKSRTDLSDLLQKQEDLASSLDRMDSVVRPRYYAADAYLADRVLRGHESPGAYAQSFRRIYSPSDLPLYEHDIKLKDPVDWFGQTAQYTTETYVFTEVLEFIPASPPWVLDPYEEWAPRNSPSSD